MIIPKDSNVKITANLSAKEVACRCGYDFCRSTVFSLKVAAAFQNARNEIGLPIRVGSGFRCSAHNKDVGGVALSKHVAGMAIDLEKPKNVTLFQFAVVLRKYFNNVIVYKDKNFCHCEVT